MYRPQFSLKTLLWLMVVVAALGSGAAWQRNKRDLEMDRLKKVLRAEQDQSASLRDIMEAERRWTHN
jgi:hypothetical protein